MRQFRADLRGVIGVAGVAACIGIGPALAQAVPPVAAPAPVSAPGALAPADPRLLAQLFENVNFWSQKGQPETARTELDRVLVLAPRDPDALALAARLAFQLGSYESGVRYRNQLKAIAPNDPRLAALDAEQPLSPAEKQQLDDARKLAATGKKDEAIAAYRQLLQHGVPDSLAIEYYQLVGTTSTEAFRQALDGLNQAAARWPGDLSFKLAAAELQTYREGSRADGIEALRALSHEPAVAAAARTAWRQALLWEGADFKTRDQVNAYLAENPTDPAMDAKVKEIQDSLPDEGVVARLRGHEANLAGHLDVAEREFAAALAFNPDDPEALAMMSLYRRLKGHHREADELVAHALRVAPDRKDEIIKIIGYDPDNPPAWVLSQRLTPAEQARQAGQGLPTPSAGVAGNGGGYRGDGGASIRRAYAHVNALAQRGDYAAAEAELRHLMGPHPQAAAFTQLGYIQFQAGELAPAESSFNRVLAARPHDTAAATGLAGVYERQGRTADAQAIYTRLGITAPVGAYNQGRVVALRAQAEAATDKPERIRLFREALAVEPANPWLKLELARTLYGANQQADARTLMAGVATGARPASDDVQAALIWAQERNDSARVEQLVAQLPAKQRTPQIVSLQARSEIQLAVQRAQAAGSPAGVRSALLAVAAQPDPEGTRGQTVAQAFLKAGDKAGARDAVRAGLASTPQPTATQRMQYAGALAQAGYNEDARQVMRPVNPASLPAAQRTTYNGVANGLAIQHADQLNLEGKRADAFEALSPRLQADPNNAGVNLAVSRLYAADGKPQQALRVAEATLQRNPSDLDATRAAVGAALQAGEIGRARQLATTAVAAHPDDPRAYLMQADIDRSQGLSGPALAALRKARSLRQEQLSQAQ